MTFTEGEEVPVVHQIRFKPKLSRLLIRTSDVFRTRTETRNGEVFLEGQPVNVTTCRPLQCVPRTSSPDYI